MNADVPSHALLLCSREFSLVCTPDGTILEVDPRAVHLLGLVPGQSLGSRCPPGAGKKLSRMLREARADPSDAWEIGLVHQGRVVTVRVHTQASGTGPAATLRLLGSLAPEDTQAIAAAHNAALDELTNLNREVVRQRTEAERLHAALADSNAGVVALQEALAERLSTTTVEAARKTRAIQHVSHELRAPLHSVLGMTQLLLSEGDEALSSGQRIKLEHVQSATEDLSLLVSDLLDLQALEAGAVTLQPERFSLSGFLSGLRGALAPSVSAAGVGLEIETPDEEVLLETDRVKLGQVLRNLIGNALAFTQEGQVFVRVRREGDSVVFAVEDTGPGIPHESQARIFEEFVRLPSAAHVSGSGLGLPVARGLTRLLGGDIALTSTPGVGSLFEASVLQVHPETRSRGQTSARQQRMPDPSGAPVLVVEDRRRTREVYARFLREAGFSVQVAEGLLEAEGLLRRSMPAALVLDLLLTRDTTWAFLHFLETDPQTARLPVLVSTVRGGADEARALGADGIFLKPLDPTRLALRLAARFPPPTAATVLAIDSEEQDITRLEDLLSQTPHTLLVASQGEQGLRLARERQPDLIVLDLLLEGDTALDVLDALKADPATRRIPVLVCLGASPSPTQRTRLAHMVERGGRRASLDKELAIHRVADALRAAGIAPARGDPAEE